MKLLIVYYYDSCVKILYISNPQSYGNEFLVSENENERCCSNCSNSKCSKRSEYINESNNSWSLKQLFTSHNEKTQCTVRSKYHLTQHREEHSCRILTIIDHERAIIRDVLRSQFKVQVAVHVCWKAIKSLYLEIVTRATLGHRQIILSLKRLTFTYISRRNKCTENQKSHNRDQGAVFISLRFNTMSDSSESYCRHLFPVWSLMEGPPCAALWEVLYVCRLK